MEKNWIKIYTGSNLFEVEYRKQMLEAHDIPAVVLNKQDSSYKWGHIELYVHESDSAVAQLLLVPNEHPNDEQ